MATGVQGGVGGGYQRGESREKFSGIPSIHPSQESRHGERPQHWGGTGRGPLVRQRGFVRGGQVKVLRRKTIKPLE